MTQIKQTSVSETTDFSGKNLFIGIDVHKKSWTVTILTEHVEHKTFTQPPDSKALTAYVRKHFPGAAVVCVYEAGFSGFWLCRQLKAAGFECLVVHPADVPTTDKEHRTKSDRIDSRKLAQSLRARQLRGVWVPSPVQQQKRSLSRCRHVLMRDLRRYKNRISAFSPSIICRSLLFRSYSVHKHIVRLQVPIHSRLLRSQIVVPILSLMLCHR